MMNSKDVHKFTYYIEYINGTSVSVYLQWYKTPPCTIGMNSKTLHLPCKPID